MISKPNKIPSPEEYLKEYEEYYTLDIQVEIKRIISAMRTYPTDKESSSNKEDIILRIPFPPNHLKPYIKDAFLEKGWDFCCIYASQFDGGDYIQISISKHVTAKVKY